MEKKSRPSLVSDLARKERILHQVHEFDIHFNKVVFWSVVVLVGIGNFLASVILIPFLAVLNKWFLDLIIILLGAGMGFIYQFLIVDIKHLDKRHHNLAGFIIPLIAIVNVIIMVGVANSLIDQLQINNIRENPFVIGLLYGIAFIAPVLYSRFSRKRQQE